MYDFMNANPPVNRDPGRKGFGFWLVVVGIVGAVMTLVASAPPGYILAGTTVALVGGLIGFTRVTVRTITLASVVLVAGCAWATADKPSWFKDSEKTSNQIAEAAFKAVPYPLSAVQSGGFLERKNQVEKLKRFSDPNKLGYVYLLSFGKFLGYYAIKGKVSAVNSQLTNENQTWDCGTDCSQDVASIGDDGTWGPNEGGDSGKFFFTTDGTMVITDEKVVYVDKPLEIGNVPQLFK